MIDNQQVGKCIAELRQRKGLSQQGLADLCSVTHQAVSKWETGQALPDMQTMLFLSKFFGLSMEDLLLGREADEGPLAFARKTMADVGSRPAADPCAAEESMARVPEEENEEEEKEQCSALDLDWQQIIELAPFASQEVIDGLLMNHLNAAGAEERDWSGVCGILPFASQKTLENLFSHFQQQMDSMKLVTIAPFVSSGFLAKAVEDMGDQADVQMLIPFLHRKNVDERIRKVWLGWRRPEGNGHGKERGAETDVHFPFGRGGEKAENQVSMGSGTPGGRERPLMRIARKAVEEGNEEWLEEHGEDLTGEELRIICHLAAEKGLWDVLTELADHVGPDLLSELAQEAARQGNEGFLEEWLDHLDHEALEAMLEKALAQSDWKWIDRITERL